MQTFSLDGAGRTNVNLRNSFGYSTAELDEVEYVPAFKSLFNGVGFIIFLVLGVRAFFFFPHYDLQP